MADQVNVTDDSGGDFEKHPAGQHIVQCMDIIDLGERYDSTFDKISKKCVLVFASGAMDKAGKLLTVQQEFTQSSGPKANLRKFLEQWRGKSYTDTEAQLIQLHKLEGVAALVVIEHGASRTGNRTFANIKSIMMPPKGMLVPVVTGYSRGEWWAKKRDAYAAEVAKHRGRQQTATAVADDDDMPGGPYEDDDDLPF